MQAVLLALLPLVVSGLGSMLGSGVASFNARPREERKEALRALFRSKGWIGTLNPAMVIAARQVAKSPAAIDALVDALEKYGPGAVAAGTQAAHVAVAKKTAASAAASPAAVKTNGRKQVHVWGVFAYEKGDASAFRGEPDAYLYAMDRQTAETAAAGFRAQGYARVIVQGGPVPAGSTVARSAAANTAAEKPRKNGRRARRNGWTIDRPFYPWAEKEAQYAAYTDAELHYARLDARKARDVAAENARAFERSGAGRGAVEQARQTGGWYADDVATILSELNRRKAERERGMRTNGKRRNGIVTRTLTEQKGKRKKLKTDADFMEFMFPGWRIESEDDREKVYRNNDLRASIVQKKGGAYAVPFTLYLWDKGYVDGYPFLPAAVAAAKEARARSNPKRNGRPPCRRNPQDARGYDPEGMFWNVRDFERETTRKRRPPKVGAFVVIDPPLEMLRDFNPDLLNVPGVVVRYPSPGRVEVNVGTPTRPLMVWVQTAAIRLIPTRRRHK